MNLCVQVSKKKLGYAATAVLMAAGMTSAYAQQAMVDDWTTHHIKFNSPGSEAIARMNGHDREWQKYVNDPRFRMQQIRRSAVWANRFASAEAAFSESHEERERESKDGTGSGSIKRDWAVQIAGTATDAMELGSYPAVYSTIYSGSLTSANCSSDYAVFPVNETESSTQANLVIFKNLYKNLCTGTVPTVAAAYEVGAGPISTSPVLSEGGAKVAFVVSISGGATFNVLTPATGTGNGTAYNAPAKPGTGNSATLTTIKMNGDVSDSLSSPWVDYVDDVAYVGDDSGNLHKFTCVFNRNSTTCTPAEVKTGDWPFSVAAGIQLTGPVYDSATGNIYVGGHDPSGYIYCITPTGNTGAAACSSAGSVSVGGSGADNSDYVNDPPTVVDNGSAASGWIFANAYDNQGNNPSAEYVMQANITATGIGTTVVRTEVGQTGTDMRDGDFDNAYYSATSDYSAGHYYYCGTAASGSAVSTLYQIGFDSAGTMDTTALRGPALTTGTGDAADCSPLTEAYNGTTDYLFLGVRSNGAPTNCSGDACVMQFTLGSSFASGFGTGSEPTTVYSLGSDGSTTTGGISGIVIDNISTTSGASQIYFGNLLTGDATQLSQSGLQ